MLPTTQVTSMYFTFSFSLSYLIGYYSPFVRMTTWLLTPLMLYELILPMSGDTSSSMSTLTTISEAFHGNIIILSGFLLEKEVANRIFFNFSLNSRCLSRAWNTGSHLINKHSTYWTFTATSLHHCIYIWSL